MTTAIRVAPATTVVHLEVNAGESLTLTCTVRDKDDELVPLQSAAAVIAEPGGGVIHTWSEQDGNLTLPDSPGVVVLTCSADDTTRLARWGDAEWQLDTVSTSGISQRVCEGDVRINPTRMEAP